MERVQQGDTTKEMRIIPEEMTEREDKNENEVNHELDAYKGRSLSF